MSEPNLPDDMPEGPSDNTTLLTVIGHYEAAGYLGQFEAEDGAMVRRNTCRVSSDAETVGMHSVRRLEGASDPDDMVAVVALHCPRCGTRGLLVLGFGPTAEGADADVLAGLRDHRRDSTVPSDAAPGETSPH